MDFKNDITREISTRAILKALLEFFLDMLRKLEIQ